MLRSLVRRPSGSWVRWTGSVACKLSLLGSWAGRVGRETRREAARAQLGRSRGRSTRSKRLDRSSCIPKGPLPCPSGDYETPVVHHRTKVGSYFVLSISNRHASAFEPRCWPQSSLEWLGIDPVLFPPCTQAGAQTTHPFRASKETLTPPPLLSL